MKFYVLSDIPDVCLGMRMAGMEGELVLGERALREALNRLGDNPDIAVIAISESLMALAPDVITPWKLKRRQPLLVEIPERLGSRSVSQNIADHIAATIGIKVD